MTNIINNIYNIRKVFIILRIKTSRIRWKILNNEYIKGVITNYFQYVTNYFQYVTNYFQYVTNYFQCITNYFQCYY